MQLDMVQVVHPGAPHAAVVEGEAAGLDHVDRQPEAGGETQDRAGVLRDVRLVEGKAHGQSLILCKSRTFPLYRRPG